MSRRLTCREIEVLKLIFSGFSSRQVADRLDVSKRTIDRHLYNVYSKLGCSNRMQARQICEKLGLLEGKR